MKKSKLLLVSWILGALYFIYIVAYTSGAISGTEGAEQAGAAIAVTLMFPHMVCVGLATLFNILGWSMNKKRICTNWWNPLCSINGFIPNLLHVRISSNNSIFCRLCKNEENQC